MNENEKLLPTLEKREGTSLEVVEDLILNALWHSIRTSKRNECPTKQSL